MLLVTYPQDSYSKQISQIYRKNDLAGCGWSHETCGQQMKTLRTIENLKWRDIHSMAAKLRDVKKKKSDVLMFCCTFYPGTGRLAGWSSCLMNVLGREGSFRG